MSSFKPMISNTYFFVKNDGKEKIVKNFRELKFNNPLYFGFTLSGIDEINVDKLYISVLYYDKVGGSSRMSSPEYQMHEAWQTVIDCPGNNWIDFTVKVTDIVSAFGLRRYDFTSTFQNIKILCTDYQLNFNNMNDQEILNLMSKNHDHDLFHTKLSMIPRVGDGYNG